MWTPCGFNNSEQNDKNNKNGRTNKKTASSRTTNKQTNKLNWKQQSSHSSEIKLSTYCLRRDFAQKVKSRGGTLVTRAYIKESTYSWNIQSVCQKKISICLNRGREESVGNCLRPQVRSLFQAFRLWRAVRSKESDEKERRTGERGAGTLVRSVPVYQILVYALIGWFW